MATACEQFCEQRLAGQGGRGLAKALLSQFQQGEFADIVAAYPQGLGLGDRQVEPEPGEIGDIDFAEGCRADLAAVAKH